MVSACRTVHRFLVRVSFERGKVKGQLTFALEKQNAMVRDKHIANMVSTIFAKIHRRLCIWTSLMYITTTLVIKIVHTIQMTNKTCKKKQNTRDNDIALLERY
ncbi:hypothetical protein H310_02084 [Aphanomyces invadans]|uniref:Uncharacterized protein n=1 Tax=Aphanomyces invadans TaxID=157072 RepID=A0A024UPP9_9STRA|nr:hypothetical protein H310_02084 [Aphanomyces invadans]ETW07608.1 hypothetical protein H310_02084 [Aphanomyces invadans]|eukprot:XP_008863701.1 hypothetical protein H310_02084 [Aphanomyces invadans]